MGWADRARAGPVGVAAGTAVLGASGYGYLTLTARAVSPGDYAALASLYLLVALVGPALFLALEQESTRVVATLVARGQGTRTAILQLLRAATVLLALATAGLVALRQSLVDHVFGGHSGLWWALGASVAGVGVASTLRGALAARRRLGGYGLVQGVDGLARLVPCIGLAAAGVSTPLPYGLALGLGPVVGAIAALALVRLGDAGPRLPRRDLWQGTSWLLVAWVLSLTLANIAPVVVTALLPGDPAWAGTFAFAFVAVRIPLFVLFALQPVLLPLLTHANATHDPAALRRGLRRALGLVGALGLVSLLAAAPAVRLLHAWLFPGSPALPAWTITVLAAGTVLAMLVQALQPALLAVAAHRAVGLAWVAGGLCFTVAFAVPAWDPVAAAAAAQLVAGLVTAAVMAVSLRALLRTGQRGSRPRTRAHQPDTSAL